MRERLLIIGGGMAGVKLVEEVLALDAERFDITMVCAETRPGYNRVLLSALLARDVGEADIVLKEEGWYREHAVRLITGDAVCAVDCASRIATLASGAGVPYDRLVFATGSDPIRLPIPGANLPGVMVFRDFQDVSAMEKAADSNDRVVVIGGGLLGIEAAYGLKKRGADVTLVHVMDRLMERQLDAAAAAILKREIERKGIKVMLRTTSAAITGAGAVEALHCADGTAIPCDRVVFAVGIRPNVALAQTSGVPVKRGILVDDRLSTAIPGIFALGECAEHRGAVYGLVEPAYQQAKVLAATLCGGDQSYEGTLLSTNLKVSGVPVFSAGDFQGDDAAERIIATDSALGLYKKLVLRNGRLAGVVLVGDADDALWYLELIRSGAPIEPMRDMLIFGPSYMSRAA